MNEQILQLLAGGFTTSATVATMIDELPDADRIVVRKEAQRRGIDELPRNLYFNYKTQVWITAEDFG